MPGDPAWWPSPPAPPVFPRVVSSWIERRKVQSEKATLLVLFDKYLPTCLDKLRVGFKTITPVPEIDPETCVTSFVSLSVKLFEKGSVC